MFFYKKFKFAILQNPKSTQQNKKYFVNIYETINFHFIQIEQNIDTEMVVGGDNELVMSEGRKAAAKKG